MAWRFLLDHEVRPYAQAISRSQTPEKYVPSFDKHVDFAMCQDGLKYAIQRAKRLDAAADAARDPGRNPTTGMWRLVESIQRET